MGKRCWFLGSIAFLLLLTACSGSMEGELTKYLEEIVIEFEEDGHDELQEIEQEFIRANEAGDPEDVLAILEDEYLPALEGLIKELKDYEIEHEEVAELNDLLVNKYEAMNERLVNEQKAFQIIMDMESDRELQEAIAILDEVIRESADYIQYRDEFNEAVPAVVKEHDLDVTIEELDIEQEITKDDIEAAVYNETGWFVQGVGYNPDVLITGKLGGKVGAIDSNNNLEVQMVGEVQIGDDYLIEGQSNLPADAELEAVIYLHDEEVSKGHTAHTEVDGSFQISIEDPEITDGEVDVHVRFRPADQDDESFKELYGEVGEEMEGDYIYLYPSIKRKYHEARMNASFNASEDDSAVFETPEWERPDDYGELDVRMEVEELIEHDAFYELHMKSNLVEGTKLKGDLGAPGYETAGFLTDAWVQPDGSFIMKLQKPDVEEADDVHLKVELIPNSLVFMYTEELYGGDGEHLEGDLVEKHKGGQKVSYIYSVNKEKEIKTNK